MLDAEEGTNTHHAWKKLLDADSLIREPAQVEHLYGYIFTCVLIRIYEYEE